MVIKDPRELGVTESVPMSTANMTNPAETITDVSGNFTFDQKRNDVLSTLKQSAETAVTKKAADTTILSGLSAPRQVQAVQNNKADIVAGTKAPGFFEGISSFIGDFVNSDIGVTLLSGIAGQAAGNQFGISNTAGFLQGASGGMEQIMKKRENLLEQQKLGITTAKDKAAAKKEDTTLTQGLRKEATADADIKNFKTIDNQVNNIRAAIRRNRELGETEEGKAAIDQALITSFNKILDPNSVVRESEFARTATSAGFFSRAAGGLEKLTTGGVGVTDKEREELVALAEDMANISRQSANQQVDFYRSEANSAGLEPDRIVKPFTPTAALPKKKSIQSKKQSTALPKTSKAVTTSTGNKFKVRSK